MPIPTHLRELMVEGLLYNWLMDSGYNSEENAYSLADLTQRSGTHVPGYMRRDGKLVNFFLDRSNIFGVVDYVVGSRGMQHPRIYAKASGKSYRQEQAIDTARREQAIYTARQNVRTFEIGDADQAADQAAAYQAAADQAAADKAAADKAAADQAAADARLSRLREYFAANAALEETERQRNSPWETGYEWNKMLGGKSKSKSRSAKKSKSRPRSARKSRSRKNRNRRSKSKSRN